MATRGGVARGGASPRAKGPGAPLRADLPAHHNLRASLPDAEFRTVVELKGPAGWDVAAEQEALKRAEVVAFVFPFYWYSFPAILKEWLVAVFTDGFAYGTNGTALHGKRLVLSFTTGGDADYVKGGKERGTVEKFLPPFLQIGHFCGFKPAEVVWSCAMRYVPDVSSDADLTAVRAKAEDHAKRLAEVILG